MHQNVIQTVLPRDPYVGAYNSVHFEGIEQHILLPYII